MDFLKPFLGTKCSACGERTRNVTAAPAWPDGRLQPVVCEGCAVRLRAESQAAWEADAERRKTEEAKRRAQPSRVVVQTAFPTAPDKEQSFTLPGGVKLEMVYLKPGTFTMGSPPSERNRLADETQHKVTLTKGFLLGKYLVTQRHWEAVTGSNPSLFAKFASSGPDFPVEGVSWNDCQEFLSKLNKQVPGGEFRLPTEAEWEYACRAGTTGAAYGELDEIAWYNQNSGESTHPVSLKRPNAWGLYDMIGNVWEWCQDLYGDDGSDGPPTVDYLPGPATDPKGRSSGKFRVRRGAGWEDRASHCRAARRNYNTASLDHAFLGMRVARTLL